VARRGHVIVAVVLLLAVVLILAVALTRPAAALPRQTDAAPPTAGATVAVAIDVQTGRDLAERWCSGCHVVRADRRVDQTPSFEAIAKDPLKTSEWLRTWLMTPHSTMPDLTLSRSEVEAIIVYLRSLGDG
jgi:mono/diheme cytochrome c family protein